MFGVVFQFDTDYDEFIEQCELLQMMKQQFVTSRFRRNLSVRACPVSNDRLTTLCIVLKATGVFCVAPICGLAAFPIR